MPFLYFETHEFCTDKFVMIFTQIQLKFHDIESLWSIYINVLNINKSNQIFFNYTMRHYWTYIV
jgi:hypothetical protein